MHLVYFIYFFGAGGEREHTCLFRSDTDQHALYFGFIAYNYSLSLSDGSTL